LMAGAYLLARVHEAGWDWARLEDFLFFSLPVGLAGILLYLPFYFGFSSQAGGILPDLVYPTRGAQLWVMFGPLLLPVLAYVLFLWRGKKCRAEWPLGLGLAVGVTLALWAFSWLMGIATIFAEPDLATQFLQMQGVADMRTLFLQAGLRRMSYIGGLLTLLAILGGALAFLASWKSRRSKAESFNRKPSNSLPLGFLGSKSSIFVLLLVVLGGLLVLAPDFVYLRDQFGYRINTIFKFYYQAWILWSLAAAFGAALLLCSLHGVWEWIYRTGLALLLLASLTYPVLGLWTKTNGFQPSTEFTLDGAAYIQRADPDEAAAIRWLDSAPPGVIAEAVGGSYTNFARISTNTGLPTVLGWPGHESQWRGGSDQQGTRQQDIQTLYSTPTWSTAESILRQYDVRYVYIGSLERTAYTLNEVKFQRHLETVFHQGNVVIYEVP
jgi:YYY domain-containing protein